MFSGIAIPTQRLESRRPAHLLQFAVERPARQFWVAHQFLPVLISSTINMIKCQEPPISFSATRAFAAVLGHNFLARRSDIFLTGNRLRGAAFVARLSRRILWKRQATSITPARCHFTMPPISADFCSCPHSNSIPRGQGDYQCEF